MSNLYTPSYIEPVPFRFQTPTGEERVGYGVPVTKDEIELAQSSQQGAWASIRKPTEYAYKRDYARGIEPDAYKIGKIGEIGAARLLGASVKIGHQERGDGGIDFELPAGTVDVKTKKIRNLDDAIDWYIFMSVAFEPRDRHVHTLTSEIFVSTLFVEIEDLVLVMGYRGLSYYQDIPLKQSRRFEAKWMNREWQAIDVDPIDDLISR